MKNKNTTLSEQFQNLIPLKHIFEYASIATVWYFIPHFHTPTFLLICNGVFDEVRVLSCYFTYPLYKFGPKRGTRNL